MSNPSETAIIVSLVGLAGCGAASPDSTAAASAGSTGTADTASSGETGPAPGTVSSGTSSGLSSDSASGQTDTGISTTEGGAGSSTGMNGTESGSTGGSDYPWDVSFEPPELIDPLVVTLPDERYLEQVPAYSILCGGFRYTIRPEVEQDVLVLFEGDVPLAYPLGVLGGRNVHIRGLEMVLEVQPGCEAGALPNVGDDPDPAMSVHPRSPAGVALHVLQSDVTFIEGTFVDLNGHETDCIVGRNPAGMTAAQAKGQRDVVIQNFACHGIEGHVAGIHGDLFQNQGEDLMRMVALENVTVRTSQEGLVLHQWGGVNSGRLEIHRYDYDVDPRFIDDDPYDNQLGVIFDASADEFTVDDAWLNIGLWGRINGMLLGEVAADPVVAHPGVHVGEPPQGEFAVLENLGRNYVSPHQ